MMRLIDAENLWLTTECTEDGNVHKYYEQFEVDEAPTIDAEPVRHGRWIGKPIGGYSTVRCSACGDVFLENNGKWEYCPNCGAKMD